MPEPASIWTQNPLVIEYQGESVETEDYTQAEADIDSFCGLNPDLTINTLCEAELRTDECNAGKRFVAASSADYSIKEFAPVYYREIAVSFNDCGEYERRGYKTKLRSGPISGGIYENDKITNRFELEASAPFQTTPSIFKLKIGAHSQAVDPNNDSCGIVWNEEESKEIECLSKTSAQSIAANEVPSQSYEWPLFYQARYLYFELTIENPESDPIDTGGACCLSRYTMDLRPAERRFF